MYLPFIGSPPHPRGIRNFVPEQSNLTRITPASAGNTETDNKIGNLNEDHPRIRGEYRNFYSFHSFDLRITPASAGNTALPGLPPTPR